MRLAKAVSLLAGRAFKAMRNRVLGLVLLLLLGCFVVGLLLLRSRDSSVTLQELSGSENRDAPVAITLDEIGQTVRDSAQQPLDIDMESLFYALLALCSILLALRTLIYIARVSRNQRLSKSARSGGAGMPRGESSWRVVPQSALGPPSVEPAAPGPRRVAAPSAISLWAQIVACGRGLAGKMVFTFAAIIAAFGLLTVATVYFALTASLRTQAVERARIAAVNVSDSAPGFVLKKNFTGLRGLLRKVSNRKDLAYVLVENRAGEILAHSFAELPEELKEPERRRAPLSAEPRRLRLREGEVSEVAVPILEGQIGAVRLGIWRDAVDAEAFQTVMPLIKIIALVIAGGIVLVVVLAWRINRPILRLVNTARSISRGDLDTPSLGLEGATEFGELSRALERMRSSVKAAMIRLSQEL